MGAVLRAGARLVTASHPPECMCADVCLSPGEASGESGLGRLTSYGARPPNGAPTGALSNSCPPTGPGAEQPRESRRARLWRLRAEARRLSTRTTVQTCGILGAWQSEPGQTLVPHTVLHDVGLGATRKIGTDVAATVVSVRPTVALTRSSVTGRARVTGVHACGSVHECPTCRDRITGERAREIQEAVERHRARGGVVMLATFTFRHHWHSPDGLIRQGPRAFSAMRKERAYREWWNALELGKVELVPKTRKVRNADGSVVIGPDGRELREECGTRRVVRCGYVRAAELTHGRFGWHPHLHVLVFLERLPETAREAARARMQLKRLWADTVARELGEAHRPSLRRGVDLQVCVAGDGAVGDYLSKLGLEVASDLEKTSSTGLTPLQLLERSAAGDLEARGLWRRYARAQVGLRQLTWSRGTRRALALPAELDDVEVARERADVTDELVLELPSRVWASIFGTRTRLATHLLDGIAQAESRESARLWVWRVLQNALGDEGVRELHSAESEARAKRHRDTRVMQGREPLRGWQGYAFTRSLATMKPTMRCGHG